MLPRGVKSVKYHPFLRKKLFPSTPPAKSFLLPSCAIASHEKAIESIFCIFFEVLTTIGFEKRAFLERCHFCSSKFSRNE
jgi:hypothetical protein